MRTLTQCFFGSLLALTCCVALPAQEPSAFVRGIVVDDKGRPVVRANVTFDMSDFLGTENCLPEKNSVLTDAEGQFFNNLKCKADRGKIVIFATSAVDLSNSVFSIFAEFWPELRRNDPKFAGLTVEIRGDQQIDLGKIPVQVWYNRVELFVINKSRKPYYKSEDDWAKFVLIVRDKKGDAVGSAALSTYDRQRSVRLDRGSVDLALPEGTWTLELLNDWNDFDQKGKTLRKLATTAVTVKKTDVCLRARLVVK